MDFAFITYKYPADCWINQLDFEIKLTLEICGEEARTIVGLHERITSQLKLIVAVCSENTLTPTHRFVMLPSCKQLREFRNSMRVLFENVVFHDDSTWNAFDVAINNLIKVKSRGVPPPTHHHQVFANFVLCFSKCACALSGALSIMRGKKLEEIKRNV